MGNTEVHDVKPCPEDFKRELDLSCKMNYRSYCKVSDIKLWYMNGEYPDQCLLELPWTYRDSVSLYERLILCFNKISSLPPELPFRLPHLSYLDLSHNQLTCLPESICLLFHLEQLLVPYNALMSLPSSLHKMDKLYKIDLSNNSLNSLPENLGYMKALTKLNVSHNNLQNLPLSLGASNTLDVILARGNKCKSQPPQVICEEGSNSILSFLRKLVLPTAKVLLSDESTNVFDRVRGNQAFSSVLNPGSARAQYIKMQTETMNTASRIRTPLLPPYNATLLEPDELRDRIVGLIYGAVIGDALGIATEWLAPDECEFYYNLEDLDYSKIIQDDHRVHWKRGDWTSNGDQMFLVLESLLQWAGVIDELDFASRLAAWKKQGFLELNDTEGYTQSHTINLALQKENYVRNPHQAAIELLQNNLCFNSYNGSSSPISVDSNTFSDSGALSRAVILGIPRFHDLQEAVSNSVRICQATHADLRCIAASVAVSVCVSLMLQGQYDLMKTSSLEEMIAKVRDTSIIHLNSSEHRDELRKYFSCFTLKSVQLNESGKQNYAFKPLAAGLVSLRSHQDFKSAVSQVIMEGGHASINGFITGAFLGCKVGFSYLPRDWVTGLKHKQVAWLNEKVNALLDIMGLP
ncbi:uncharacterized protein LOC106467938 isoform X1 [Limulus polyphemus]|uniref:Uncharacterized protein LOC106467938 isoform X1 n=1 Tax=Limulus polyphemus TaxID=6850 RepID=A0ABM1T7L8_LIMPO|nr:uncharacterized protein LOC106467938 isoform X1 [Limulus polyphemus]XP_022251875.1 uncharacterized protein LOC106467938 isoform X1 [Limulus polyphemus]